MKIMDKENGYWFIFGNAEIVTIKENFHLVICLRKDVTAGLASEF